MSRPRIYTPEEIRERRRLRGIEYRKRNREKIRAYKKRPEVRERRKAENRRWREKNRDYARAYYAAHKDAFREYHLRWLEKWGVAHGVTPRELLTDEERLARRRASRRKWNEANRDKMNAYCRAWKKRNTEKSRAATRAYQKAHPEYKRMYRMRCIVREMTDCEYYAERRRKARERANRRRLRMGLSAVGKPARRIPDWCVKGGVLDCRSQWLFCNATPEQRAYARELAIERKQWRTNNEWRMAK